MADIVCWNCGASLADVPRPISRHANCPACFEDLHCCRLCRHYAPRLTGQCEDDRTDPPVHKETANFCDFFRPISSAYRSKTGTKRDAARTRLDALFGKDDAGAAGEGDDPPTTPSKGARGSQEEQARAKLDALFGKDGDS